MPVGSQGRWPGSVNLSPASIRGVMQELEELGLLTHPHTSAGRMPTESGLRLFVDGIMQAAAPDPTERARDRAADRPRPADRGGAGGGLGGAVGPVAGGRRGAGAQARDRSSSSSSFVALAPGQALAVLVGADGSVENRIVALDGGHQRRRARRGQQFRQRAAVGPDAGRGRGAAARRDPRAARRRSTAPRPSWSRRASPTGPRTRTAARC